jgi:hypothetical protein
MIFHPDRNRNDPHSVEKFKEVSKYESSCKLKWEGFGFAD